MELKKQTRHIALDDDTVARLKALGDTASGIITVLSFATHADVARYRGIRDSATSPEPSKPITSPSGRPYKQPAPPAPRGVGRPPSAAGSARNRGLHGALEIRESKERELTSDGYPQSLIGRMSWRDVHLWDAEMAERNLMRAEDDLTIEQEDFDAVVDTAARLWNVLQETEKVPEYVARMARDAVRRGDIVGGFNLNDPDTPRDFPERSGTVYQKSAAVLELEELQRQLAKVADAWQD